MKNKDNFFTNTKANFLKVENIAKITNQKPDFISYTGRKFWADYDDFDAAETDEEGDVVSFMDFEDGVTTYEVLQAGWENSYLVRETRISSQYWYTNEGVYRMSNHWGNCATCFWSLNNQELTENEDLMGFCSWSDFSEVEIEENVF